MDINFLTASGVDWDSGLRRFMGNEELYSNMLVKFLEDTGISAAGAALAAKDYEELHFRVHTLKGTGGNLSLTVVYDCTVEILVLLKNRAYDALPEAMERLTQAHALAIRAIEKACTQKSVGS